MTCVLDLAVNVGQMRFAVVSQTFIVPQGSRNAASFTGGKLPVFVLMENDHGVSAFDMSGRKTPLAEIEKLCPGVCAGFASSRGGASRD